MNSKFTSKFLILMALFVLFFSSAFAGGDIDESEIANKLNSLAGTTNVGREYIFSIPPPYENAPGSPFIRVFIVSPVATSGVVSIAGTEKPFKSQGNGLTVVDISAAAAAPFLHDGSKMPPPARVYKDKSIRILAEEPVVVYVIVRYKYTTDGFLAIPISSLGRDYVAATSPQWGKSGFNLTLTPWINITAAFDKTKVTFTMGGGKVQSFTEIDGGQLMGTGDSKNWTLNKGETLIFGASSYDSKKNPINGDGQDITGSRISSNRPVAVVTGHNCSNIPIENPACDYTCEMELPTVSWGKNIVVPQLADRKKPAIIRIFSKEEETDIFRNGTYFTTISKTVGAQGESFQEQRIWPFEQTPASAVFTSTKPFYIMYYNPGQVEDNIASDPFVMVMTPVEQYQHDIIFCTPNAAGGDPFTLNWLNVVVEVDENGYVPNDFEFGTFTSDWQWQKVRNMSGLLMNNVPAFNMDMDPLNPKRKFLIKNISLPYSGVFRLRCPSRKFASYSYGYGTFESYGYPTSAALSDLSTIDIWKPIPTYLKECDGDINEAKVVDPLINNDQSTRSKLSDAYMKQNESFNYIFKKSSEIIPGEVEEVSWTLKKTNPRDDAKAVLVFIDKAGNDTTITIEDYATKLDLAQDENYGNFKLNDPAVSKSFTVTNNSKKTVLIKELKLWKNNQGFKLEPLNWKFSDSLQIGETRLINITFTPDNNLPVGEKLFIDSLGVGDSCLFANLVEIRASLGTPKIDAAEAIFGTFNIDDATPLNKKVRVQNPSKEADLTIIGASAISNSSFTATFDLKNGTIKKTQDITPQNPVTIKADGYIEFDVYFKPTTSGTFTDKIVFTADASIPDNQTDLYGVGVQAQLSVNSLDWGEYRVTRPAFPINPKAGTENGSIVMTFVNNGTLDVTINSMKLKVNSGDESSFKLEDQKTPVSDFMKFYGSFIVPANTKATKQIYFSPNKTGRHDIELSFDNSIGDTTVIAKLQGTGIVPRMVITPTIPFAPSIVGDNANPQKGTLVIANPKKSSTEWEFGDTLTLGNFNPNPAIASNLNSFGTEGFRYANSGIDSKGSPIPNLNGYRIAPGEEIYVSAEFVAQKAGPANATLVLNSDAEVSADPLVFNNTSVWSGTGLVQGVTVGTQNAFICTGTVAKLNFVMTNTGTTNITISNFTADYSTNLVLDDPSMLAPFTILAGSSKSFTMTFSPIGALARRTVTLSYNTDILGDVAKRTATFEIESFDFSRTSRSNVFRINSNNTFGVAIPPTEGVSIGDQFGYNISFDPGANFDNAAVGNFEVSFTYPTEFIKPIYTKVAGDPNNSLMIGSALAGKFEIDYASIKEMPAGTNAMKIVFTVKPLGTNILQGDGEIASVRFRTFLPTYTQANKDVPLPTKYTAVITHTLSDLGNPCFEFVSPSLSTAVALNDICAAPIRAIVLGSTPYELKQINPNPVGSNGANIDFSVGIAGQTEVVIYNSNKEVVATVASGLFKEGTYSVPLPIEKLASGTYFYELKSGFYTDVKPLVIVK